MPNDRISVVGTNIAEKATMIWNVADMLRGPFKPHEYGLVILPMTVVKRFHDCLLPKHQAVLDTYEKVKHLAVTDGFLRSASGYQFYNTSKFTFERLLADPDNIESNFRDYLNGFSANVQDVLSKFDFDNIIKRMVESNTLYLVIKEFASQNTDKADLRFINYIFQNVGFQKELRKYANGILEIRMRISSHDMLRRIIPIPVLSEQKRIADYLDTECDRIDGVIDQTRASIEEYKKLKQAVITHAVTKGIRPNRQMKDSGIEWIGKIPEDWRIFRLRHIGTTQNGISKGGEFFGQGYPFVSYGDVYRNYSLPNNVEGLIQSTAEEQELYSVQRGDIFFTRTSETIEEVGFSCVCEQTIPQATFAGFLIRVRPFDDTIDTSFAKYYFRSMHHRFYLVKQMNLVTRASLGQTLLKGMHVLVPDNREQKEIAEYLDNKCSEIDKLIATKEKTISELESYKKSLIYEYVTGKKEVPVCQ